MPELLLNKIKQQGVLPLYFHPDPTVCIEVLKALYAAGIRVIEFTNRGVEAQENFSLLRAFRDREMPDVLLGVGTLKNGEQARHFVAEGADFLISPGLALEVGEVARMHNLLWVPGCMTPTEIIAAENAGVRLVKLFPGNLLGPAFLGAIKELFPNLHFMPTGGVEVEKANIEAWFKSGVCAVGMGSKLISAAALEKKDYTGITQLTNQTIAIIQALKK